MGDGVTDDALQILDVGDGVDAGIEQHGVHRGV